MKKKSFPIAIVGMALRFPGDLSDEQSFWQALRDGRDLVSQIDAERWSTELLEHPRRSEAGRSVSFSAGVLSRIDEFDADFFGISPREAAWLDPQQRLLLELAWEAIENSGVKASALAGSDCAVYVGIAGVDYGMRAMTDLAGMTAHSMTGNTFSIAANRLSYVFDLHGPSIAVDTACSSSLVALHQACNSLRSGESSVALVGGVNLLLHPYPFIGFTKASMLSANGRCRAFDAAGDGYVRSEGGAVLMLKPLAQAVADGDSIQAVILASGANADGSRKTGMTIPSSDGQAELMRAVLLRSGLAATDIDYIEAHGTGTAVGDPIEAAAIGAIYGRCRSPERRLPVGSVKTNIGHLEAAAGIAGLAKAVLILKNRALPPSLHCVTRNPHIDFDGMNLDLVDAYRPFPKSARKQLVVGVNSFGFGGANAHVLLQEFAPRRVPRQAKAPPPAPLVLSARTPQALLELAGRYAALLREQPESHYDLAYSAAQGRDRLDKRLAVPAGSAGDVADQLARFAAGESVAQIVLEDALPEAGGVAFIYSGNGSQWLGMGRKLIAESPRFAEVIAELDALIKARAGFSIIAELHAEEPSARLDDTAVAQPLLFALQVALTRLLNNGGVSAQAVAGHSVGEVAAAWAAGAVSLEQAVEVICVRSAAQTKTRGVGRMAAIGLGEDATRRIVEDDADLAGVEIAGINGPHDVTVSGPLACLVRLAEILAGRGASFHLLDLDYAFHSPAMDAIEDEIVANLATLTPRPAARATFVSTVSGQVCAGEALDAAYWWRNVRRPVRFSQAIAALAAQGCRVFVEIGPRAILQRYLRDSLAATTIRGRVLPTLHLNDDALARVDAAVLHVHLLLEPHRLLEVFFGEPGRRLRLPNYPWQRERHWHPRTSESNGALDHHRVHPLLGWRLKETASAWENALDPDSQPWLADHQVGGAIVLPGAAYVEMALAAAREHFGGDRQEIEQLEIVAPIVFDGEHSRSLRFELSPRDGSFTITSRQRLSDDEWMLNAVGRVLGAPTLVAPPCAIAAIDAAEEAQNIDRTTHYRLATTIGLDYGPAFQRLLHAEVQGERLQATLVATTAGAGVAPAYLLHPTLLDACFQSLIDFFAAPIENGQGVPLLPVSIGRLRLYGNATITSFRTHIQRRNERSVAADFELVDADGGVVASLHDCRFKAAALQRSSVAEPACWQIVPRLRPLAAEQRTSQITSTQDLSQRLLAWFTDAEAALDRGAYFQSALPLLEALTVAFVRDAFQTLLANSGVWLQAALDDPESVEPTRRPLFRWLVDILTQENLLVKDAAGTWRVDDADLPPAPEIWRTLLRDHAASLPELVLTANVGTRLADALSGRTDARALADGLRQSHHADTLFDQSPAYRGTRLAIEQVLTMLASDWPTRQRLRILEVVAGTTGVLPQLVEIFPPERLDYVISHFDEEACARLQSEHTGQASVTVARFDSDAGTLVAERPLPEHFDAIILRHSLHGAPEPAEKLALLRRRLVGGGLLIVAERHPDLNAEFVAGAVFAAARQNADGGVASGLASPRTWKSALEEQGFSDIEVFREPASEGVAEGAYLLIAKRPEEDLVAAGNAASANWLLVCDSSATSRPLADRLRSHLESEGQRVVVAPPRDRVIGDGDVVRPGMPVSAQAILAEARQALESIDHVVYLTAADAPSPARASGITRGALGLVQAIDPALEQPRLWLVTVGAAGAHGSSPLAPEHGALWGFGRVVMNEYPALACTLINVDLDPASSDAVGRLQAELLEPDGEKEILISSRGRHGLRMEPAPRAEAREGEGAEARFRLDFLVPGQLRNLVWLPQAERELGDGEVEVRVMATGLNFRDVMYLMGVLPDEAVENGFAGASLGLEFAGVVTRVGKRAADLAVGDAVMGFSSACFASHVVTEANALTLKPAEWSFEAAATVPTAFFTVYYALKHLADLQPGERVLIHGAAGGVGIAAVQLAQHLGAEVFATAGSDEKRDFVKLLGADHVLDSRSLAFADDILTLTGGEGVDVVLNSLAGEAIRRNLHILKPFGRLLELGKRDFFENTPIGLRPFKDNISYFGIDADQLLRARPALAARLFRDVMGLFRDGVLFPLPYRVFPAQDVVDAFRTMQQSRHIGKVVVTIADARVQIETKRTATTRVALKKDSTWLVTGGLSGFGLESARWLAERGVGQLVLAGRRGIETPGAAAAVLELEALGVRVKAFACDIANAAAVQQMLADVHADCPPLVGIVHAAMALDDGLIAGLDGDRLRRVFAPKVMGAWHLHNLTRELGLEHFVLYSSMTTFIGNPGQASYVAANAALESLAALRHSQGLPATCIAWGPIGDAGYLTRNEAVKDALASRLGKPALAARSALAILDHALTANGPCTAVVDFEWASLAALLASAQEPRFEALRRLSGPASDAGSDNADVRALIAGKTADEVHAIVSALVTQEVAQILCVAADRIDPARSLHDLGMDSLMGMELALGLEKRFLVQLPAMLLNEGPTVDRVSLRIVERLLGSAAGSREKPGDAMAATVTLLAAQHGADISVEELAETAHVARIQARAGG